MVESNHRWFFYGYIVILAAFSMWMTAWGIHNTSAAYFSSRYLLSDELEAVHP
jgi:hypothetical protein